MQALARPLGNLPDWRETFFQFPPLFLISLLSSSRRPLTLSKRGIPQRLGKERS